MRSPRNACLTPLSVLEDSLCYSEDSVVKECVERDCTYTEEEIEGEAKQVGAENSFENGRADIRQVLSPITDEQQLRRRGSLLRLESSNNIKALNAPFEGLKSCFNSSRKRPLISSPDDASSSSCLKRVVFEPLSAISCSSQSPNSDSSYRWRGGRNSSAETSLTLDDHWERFSLSSESSKRRKDAVQYKCFEDVLESTEDVAGRRKYQQFAEFVEDWWTEMTKREMVFSIHKHCQFEIIYQHFRRSYDSKAANTNEILAFL